MICHNNELLLFIGIYYESLQQVTKILCIDSQWFLTIHYAFSY